MIYKVTLHRDEEGISVCVPALPGCWSEGDTEAEAMETSAMPFKITSQHLTIWCEMR